MVRSRRFKTIAMLAAPAVAIPAVLLAASAGTAHANEIPTYTCVDTNVLGSSVQGLLCGASPGAPLLGPITSSALIINKTEGLEFLCLGTGIAAIPVAVTDGTCIQEQWTS